MKNEDGLPDVTPRLVQKKAILLIVVGLIVVMVVGIYSQAKPKAVDQPEPEETYSSEISNGVGSNAAETDQAVTSAQMEAVLEKQKALLQRLSAPLMIVNNTVTDTSTEQAKIPPAKSTDPNTQFMNQLSGQGVESSAAASVGSLSTLIAAGTLIHAALESATDSDLPGFLRASVSEPIYSEDGTRVLIPRGSRLIGQYKSGMLQNQTRIFIVWTRVLTPSGIAVNLSSAGVDDLGVAGVGADEVNRHFWQRFGTASLLSIIGAGVASASGGVDSANPTSLYSDAVASSFAQSAGQSLQQENNIAPTLSTYQGKPIVVFVTRDLHFNDAMQESKPNVIIF